jgi:hypothetical protein
MMQQGYVSALNLVAFIGRESQKGHRHQSDGISIIPLTIQQNARK